jgi:hypothetical protein
MKNKIVLIAVLINSHTLLVAQDTLRNLQNSIPRTVDSYSTGWGYFTGHNSRSTEEFAEKYYIEGTRKLVGVISEHTGKVTNTTNTSQFKAYTVGTNHMPATLKASKNVPYGQIDLTGTPMVTMFPSPATVTDSFFVSFNLTDYAHGGFEGDTIGLLYGTNGSRSNSDLALLGRNAVRHHSHGSPTWKDFYSQNFTPVATHFALFPILESTTTGNENLTTSEFEITRIFPNPFVENITIQVKSKTLNNILVYFYSEIGQLVKTKIIQNTEFSKEEGVMVDCQELPTGNYLVLIKGQTSGIGTRILKH